MRICDKCKVTHAEYKVSTIPMTSFNRDVCRVCLTHLTEWFDEDDCIPCNKEEGYTDEDDKQ